MEDKVEEEEERGEKKPGRDKVRRWWQQHPTWRPPERLRIEVSEASRDVSIPMQLFQCLCLPFFSDSLGFTLQQQV